MKNSQSGDDKLGVIYITFSDMANQAPIIAQPKYDINANNPAITARSGESLTLDLSQLTDLGITDPEGGDWQLVEVKSFTADVSPADKDAITNKAFMFSAGTVGDHYISYIVADEYNGFTSGLLKLHVAPNEHPAGWSSLVDDNNHTFTAPELYSKVDAQGYKVSAVWDNTVSDTLAGFDAKSGDLYCQSQGLLPTVSDLAALRQAHLNGEALAEDLAQWPLEKTYLALDGDSVKGFNFTTGHADDYDPSTPYYVTCLANNEMTLNMKRFSVVANGDSVVLATVTQPTGGKGITLEKLSGSLSDNDVNISTDSQGKVTTLTTTSTKAGSYRFKVTDNGDADNALTSPEVTYLADADTAAFPDETGLVVTKDKAAADGKAQDTLQVTVEDANGNPVAGLPIMVEVEGSDSVTFKISPSMTDKDGHVTILVSDRKVGSVDITAHTTRPSGERIDSEVESINFTDIDHSGGFPCPEGGFACLPVLKSQQHSGTWYTPDPETNYMKKISYLTFTDGSVGENGHHGISGFYGTLFSHNHAQMWCQKLADDGFEGRHNWALPNEEQLQSLYSEFNYIDPNNALFTTKQWPTSKHYWTNEAKPVRFSEVDLSDGAVYLNNNLQNIYVSCVSTQE
ncbi:Ig-like domain-containing protein [Photobacterium sp. SKA34]|uniref:Ig-like domain-containing protein n=1 Tax=Photobacterium sp. SKA34 TaxID=121723 RepID=UPI001E4B48E5|nr:Ig-like domain-containing protein [Photobacterium sp. SKA34]